MPPAPPSSAPLNPSPEAGIPQARETYLDRQPSSRYWVDFADFHFFRLTPSISTTSAASASWAGLKLPTMPTPPLTPSPPTPPASSTHMNADHVASMITLARTNAQLDATEAAMTSIDRLGFTLRLKTAEGMKSTRINFPNEVTTPTETRTTLIAMLRSS